MTLRQSPKTLRRRFQTLFSAALAASTFVATTALCANETPTSLKVAAFPYLSFAPLYVAESEGYFSEQDLDVELVRFQNNSESLAALITGNIDVDAIFTVGLVNAIARGEALRVVANKGLASADNCPADGFMVRTELTEQMKSPTPEFLKSLTYGVDPVWIDSYFLDLVLGEYGIGLDDIRTEYVPNPAARMDALSNGAVDIAFFSEPFITRVAESGGGAMWRSVADIVPGYSLGVINFGPNILSSDRDDDAGVRFMRAYLKAIAQLDEGKTERNVKVLAEATRLDPDILRRICWPSFDKRGQVDASAIGDYSQWAVGRGLADRSLSPEEFWAPRFANSAAKDVHGEQ